jgi:hypothetical protein
MLRLVWCTYLYRIIRHPLQALTPNPPRTSSRLLSSAAEPNLRGNSQEGIFRDGDREGVMLADSGAATRPVDPSGLAVPLAAVCQSQQPPQTILLTTKMPTQNPPTHRSFTCLPTRRVRLATPTSTLH